MTFGGSEAARRPVRDIVRAVVTEVSPDELPLVEGLSGFDDAVVVRRLSRRGRRETLGFGMAEIAGLVTPVVWLVLDEMAHRIGEKAADGAFDGLKVLVRKVFRRKSGPVEIPPLTRDQLDEVHRLILESTGKQGFPPGQAAAVADAVLRELVLTGPDEPAAPLPPSPEPAPGGGAPAE
ncbi:hypothetical protein [Nocardia aurantia]|uniref:Uncharacterized protein n=1 Tax=Nocardia aurantia TaxID=2585199 RepID=A0A7K0DLN3_9NOCA|nr:hypothetical protein [Nocardia aurantia]MQY26567.1 hypothetical protein [Nocardia aurantia]